MSLFTTFFLLCIVNITAVRLVGGGSCTTRGRVEYLVGGTQWQAACDGNFGQSEADVVCRQLGQGPALMWYKDSKFQPSKHIVHEPIACIGTESAIGDCSLAPHIPAPCDNDHEAGVFCSEREGGKLCMEWILVLHKPITSFDYYVAVIVLQFLHLNAK